LDVHERPDPSYDGAPEQELGERPENYAAWKRVEG
jgi:hypothetical protein